MKTKNLALALVAFTLAIGGAIASSFVATSVIVHAQVSSDTDPITCFNTGVSCDETGSAVCSVSITRTRDNTLQVAQTNGTYKTYKPNTSTVCTQTLNNSNATTIASGQSVYELFN